MRPRLALVALAFLCAAPARGEDALISYKSLSPEVAFDLARAALASCRERGFQVSVAVVDRFGVTQVVLRDRFAGAHTCPPRLARPGPRGLGLEVRILGVDPEAAESRAREGGFSIHLATRERPGHGWRECYLEDPDGYVFAVGVPIE